ncbi:hypothetical protein PAXRUDRAFT_491066 [Paxillus rubicundulus Ve08.2h10]|uniref:Uncharacterized protein n=1 Tax=Paxillus rubicundulus Ve08.2h10 TaxID=930991 RepID=A0A0D0DLS2_9AGAM|nr:hypothetical protein PAXRUDRAFT_491066 [Paxillus rubicundulus Ve08.2h10]
MATRDIPVITDMVRHDTPASCGSFDERTICTDYIIYVASILVPDSSPHMITREDPYYEHKRGVSRENPKEETSTEMVRHGGTHMDSDHW